MTDTWMSVAARDGAVITEMPELIVDGDTIAQTMGRYETATAHLPISAGVAPPDWKRGTKKGASFLVFLEDSAAEPRGMPRWGGLIINRTRTESNLVDLSLITGEGYLDRRYTGDLPFTGVGQNTILSTLVGIAVDGANGKNGIPIRVVNLDGNAGTLRDRTYADQDDKTVYAAITELSGVDSGPEWTIGWEWVDTTHLGMVCYVGSRLGSSPIPGLVPDVWFDLPGNVSSFSLSEDYTSGKGATNVVAVSSGEGTTRPQSTPMIVNDADRPTYEYRWTPSTSIIDVQTLNTHATEELGDIAEGTTSLTLRAQFDAAPKLGIDWGIGDEVGFDIAGSVPAFAPEGLSGTARVAGWQRTLTGTKFVAPTLILPGDIDD